ELAEKERLLRELFGARIVWIEPNQLVTERADASRFQTDDKRSLVDISRKAVHNRPPSPLGAIEHAPIVERPAAAQRTAGNGDRETEGVEHACGGNRGRWPEVIVECIGPQHHPFAPRRMTAGAEPLHKALASIARHGALLSDASAHLTNAETPG